MGILQWMCAFVQWKQWEKGCRFRKPQLLSELIERRCIAGLRATIKTA